VYASSVPKGISAKRMYDRQTKPTVHSRGGHIVSALRDFCLLGRDRDYRDREASRDAKGI